MTWGQHHPDIFRAAYGLGNGRRAPVVTSTLLIGGPANGKHDAETQRAGGQLIKYRRAPLLRAYRSEPGMLPRSDELLPWRQELYLRRSLWLHPASVPLDMFVFQDLSAAHAIAVLEEFHVRERPS